MEEGAAKRLRVLSTITERPFKRLKTEEEPPLTEDDGPDPSEWSDTAENESETYNADISSKGKTVSDKKSLTSSLNGIEYSEEEESHVEPEDSGDDYDPSLERKLMAKKGKGSVTTSKPWQVQKERYKVILHCTDSDIEDALAALGLPCYLHKLSRSDTKEDGPKVASSRKKSRSTSGNNYHSASTVTPDIMEKRGWHFRTLVASNYPTNAPRKEPKAPKITYEEIYQPMSSTHETIPITSSPIRLDGQGSEDSIQQIPRALRLMKALFDGRDNIFMIPREWLEESYGDLGLQPCLPHRFEICIRRAREMKGLQDELQTPGPSFASTQSAPGSMKKDRATQRSGDGESIEGTFELVTRQSLSFQATNDGALPSDSTPSTPKPIKTPVGPGNMTSLLSPYKFKTPTGSPIRGSTRSLFHLPSPSPYPRAPVQTDESDDSRSLTIENLRQHNFHADTHSTPKAAQTLLPQVISSPKNPVVEELVKKLGLEENDKAPTLDFALELQKALLPLQLEYDKKKYKKRICEQVGIPKSADSVAKADPSTGTSSWVNVVYESRETIINEDRSRRIGNTTLNENANDINGTEMKIIWKWAEFDGSTLVDPSEGAVEKEVGGLLHGIFFSQTGELKQIENEEMEIAYPLRLFGTNPHPDFAVQLQGENWAHWGKLAPCVFSAECKREDTISAKSEAQLAMNSHAILNIFVIMHLDMRTTQYDPMRAWMWVFGLLYTEKGFSIYGHYPRVIKSEETKKGYIWEFQSCRLTDEFMNLYVYGQTKIGDRLRALATLWRIRSHTYFVIEQIRQWAKTRGQYAGGKGPIDKLIIMAQLELRNVDWLEARIKEMQTAKKGKARIKEKDPSAKAIREKQSAEEGTDDG